MSSNGSSRRRALLGRVGLVATGTLVALTLVAMSAIGVARQVLRASLPALDGTIPVPGLAAGVGVERDPLGVPTIRASGGLDAQRALGFLHGQERFFQMDLARRAAAGELAALFGAAALEADREVRLHRFRARARARAASASPEEQALLEAYADGVNTGLATLRARPFEYLLLRREPQPWRPEDTLLVVYSMYLELQDESGRRDARTEQLHRSLPAPLAEFLDPRGTSWDAAMDGSTFDPVAVPGPEVLDLRRSGPSVPSGGRVEAPAAPAGSNSWAVAGTRTADGRALLAGDMHLPLRVPATWYRASLVVPAEEGAGGKTRALRVTGVTLPGVPGIIAGSNGSIAWAFTNSYVDTGDLVVVEEVPGSARYLTPEGERRFETAIERIEVDGDAPVELEVTSTIWGPLVGRDAEGRPRAYRWIAHDPDAVNLELTKLARARTVDEALALAPSCGMPAQNLVVADADGRVGWTVIGRVPLRVGFDGRRPVSFADGSRAWVEDHGAGDRPRIVDPPRGLAWTANARVVGGSALARLGDGGYDLGARAHQIAERLAALERPDERAMLALQLDDRALFLSRWRELLLQALDPDAVGSDPRRAEARRLIESWGDRASPDSVGYRIVRGFRIQFARQTFRPLVAACESAAPGFNYLAFTQWEGPLWRLARTRPAHLLDPRFASWNEAILTALDATLAELTAAGEPLAAQTWGRRNRVAIAHPLSGAIPFAAEWLDMPAVELPGDLQMPRVQAGALGASQRMVVSPGHEEDGLFEMPCGQSGHPLSAHYRDQHDAWVRGAPTPFLPGATVHRLDLVPAR